MLRATNLWSIAEALPRTVPLPEEQAAHGSVGHRTAGQAHLAPRAQIDSSRKAVVRPRCGKQRHESVLSGHAHTGLEPNAGVVEDGGQRDRACGATRYEVDIESGYVHHREREDGRYQAVMLNRGRAWAPSEWHRETREDGRP